MRAWFESLQPRERAMVSIGAVAAAVIVFWGYVWTPLQNGRADLQTSVAEKRQLLTSLYRSSAISVEPVAGDASASQQSLVLLIAQTAQGAGLANAITSSRPDGPNNINVTVQNVPFDLLVNWLVALQQNYGVSVQGASINNTRQIGQVSGQLALSRS